MPYRVRITYSYNNTANATTAQGNINTYLAGLGRPETCSRTTTALDLQIDDLTEQEATTIGLGLTTSWAVGTRTGGKASIVRLE